MKNFLASMVPISEERISQYISEVLASLSDSRASSEKPSEPYLCSSTIPEKMT